MNTKLCTVHVKHVQWLLKLYSIQSCAYMYWYFRFWVFSAKIKFQYQYIQIKHHQPRHVDKEVVNKATPLSWPFFSNIYITLAIPLFLCVKFYSLYLIAWIKLHILLEFENTTNTAAYSATLLPGMCINITKNYNRDCFNLWTTCFVFNG